MANLAIYSEKIIQMFKECQLEDMPPHIYSVAQQVRYFEFSSSFFCEIVASDISNLYYYIFRPIEPC